MSGEKTNTKHCVRVEEVDKGKGLLLWEKKREIVG